MSHPNQLSPSDSSTTVIDQHSSEKIHENEEDATPYLSATGREDLGENGHNPRENLEDQLGDSHVHLLETRKLVICLLGMSLSLFACFCDQTSVTVALPYIAKDLNAADSINWSGTSSLVANCVSQVLFGRFADIFGRKGMLIFSLTLLLISNLLCGFAQTAVQFYVFRAFAGIGAGGAQSLAMVIVSDVVTLRQRGKFQGILGANVGLGSAAGPLIMGAFTQRKTWRDFYRTLPPIIAVVIIMVYSLVENKKSKSVLTTREKLKKIDYYGILFATAGLLLILIPIVGGGSTYAWDSAIVIAMFTVGGLCLIAFVVIEWKIPELPMIPPQLFKNYTMSLLFGTTFLFGMAYYSFTFIVLYYFELVRGFSPMRSAVLLLPLVFVQATMSTVAGSIMSYIGHFLPIMYSGYLFWLTGCGMTIAWNQETSIAYIAGTLIMLGTGIGFIFQPTMVALQASSRMAQRAVAISTRNVIRSFGSALGIAFSSLIITNTVIQQMKSEKVQDNLPADFLKNLKTHVFVKPDTSGLTASQLEIVKAMYMKAIRNVFYFTIPLIAVCLISTFFLEDHGLQSTDQLVAKEKDAEAN